MKKIDVLHDEHGEIIAISNVGDLRGAGIKFSAARMIPAKGQRILEIELRGEQEKKSMLELHKDFRIDLSTTTLVSKAAVRRP
jgi:hypothetical protein